MTGDASLAADTAAVAVAAAGAAQATTSSTPPAQVTPITIGQSGSGTIASPTQTDDYTFTATAGQVVYLQTHATCAGSLGWQLLGPGGGSLAGSLVCNDLQRQVLQTEGTYTIRVNADHSAAGDYSFSLLAVPATVVTSISIGQTVSGAVSQPGQWVDYTLTASAGQTVYLKQGSTCTNGLRWELVGPDGSDVASTVACSDLQRQVLQAGTSTVRVYGDHATVGAFSFTVLGVPATQASPISIGQTVSGSLTAAGQWAEYTFKATAEEAVTLQAKGACVDGLSWALVRPDGTVQAFTVACRDLGAQILQTAGTYTIRVYGDHTSIGAYQFTLGAGS